MKFLEMATYNIVPIEGREVIQKNFISLPDKGDNYSGRRVSLNERFSIIGKYYCFNFRTCFIFAF